MKNTVRNHSHSISFFNKERESVILQSIGDAVIATDIWGNISIMNSVAENLTGWKSEEGENKPLSEVFHIFDERTNKEIDNPIKEVIKTGKIVNLADHTFLLSKDGKTKHSIADSCSPILDTEKNIIGVVIVFRDITKQRHEEEHKEKITADLIQRNKDQEQFSRIISHDLRGPLSNITGLTSLINGNQLHESERGVFLNALSTSAIKLNEVIVDLNEILNTKRELVDKRELIHFSKLVNDIKESISFVVLKEEIQFKIDFKEVDEIFSIKSHIYSIFYNLISNSIKYRRHAVSPCISITSKLIKNKIILTFKDNGLGIDLSKSGDEIFGLYKRFHTDKAEGRGMGLYMVKLQVEKLGGKISVDSIINEGSEFTIEFNNKGNILQ